MAAAVVEARRVAVRDRAAGELPVLIGESLRAAIIEDAALIAAVAIIDVELFRRTEGDAEQESSEIASSSRSQDVRFIALWALGLVMVIRYWLRRQIRPKPWAVSGRPAAALARLHLKADVFIDFAHALRLEPSEQIGTHNVRQRCPRAQQLDDSFSCGNVSHGSVPFWSRALTPSASRIRSFPFGNEITKT